MGQERKEIKKRYSFIVDTPSTTYQKKFDLDKNVKLVRGLLITSNKPNVLFFRGSQRIELSGEELYPEDYESKLLMTGMSVPPDQKYQDMGDNLLAGNGELKVWFKDTDNPMAIFEPYEVSIYLLCELN